MSSHLELAPSDYMCLRCSTLSVRAAFQRTYEVRIRRGSEVIVMETAVLDAVLTVMV